MDKNEQTPTVNGIIKGRPGKGRVLSLGQRRRCYDGHAMTPENTFRYRAKKVAGKPRPIVREWCKRCRTASRKRSRAKRLEEAKAAALLLKREARAKAKPATTKRGKAKVTPQVPALAGMTPLGKAKRKPASRKAA